LSGKLQAETLGEVIANRREELGLSRRELAQAMQTHIRNVERWEKDQVVPRGHHFWLLLSALSLRLAAEVDGAPKAVTDELNRLSERMQGLEEQMAKLAAGTERMLSMAQTTLAPASAPDRQRQSHKRVPVPRALGQP
jgi:transcriptional regulator with XRE-family HTH domain